jgi:hypothetical protein
MLPPKTGAHYDREDIADADRQVGRTAAGKVSLPVASDCFRLWRPRSSTNARRIIDTLMLRRIRDCDE